MFSHGKLNYVTHAKTFSTITTILMCLSTGDWIYLHVSQKCRLLYLDTVLLSYDQLYEKVVGNFLASDYGTLMSPTTDDNSNCW